MTFAANTKADYEYRRLDALEAIAFYLSQIVEKLGGDREDNLNVTLFTDNPIKITQQEDKMDEYEVIPQIDGDKYEIVHTKGNFTESVGGEFNTVKEALEAAKELAQKNNGVATISTAIEGGE